MTESNFNKRISFYYLDDIKSRFTDKYNYQQREAAIAFSFNNTFSQILKERMVEKFN